MKNIFLLILVLVSATLFSQNNRLGIFFSPDIAHRKLQGNTGLQPFLDARNNNEIPKWGFTTGINYERKITGRLALATGLFFADKGYQTRQSMLTYISQPPQGFTPVHFAASFKYNFYQITLPLGVTYYFTNPLKKTRFFVNGGIDISYLIKVRSKAILYRTGGGEDKTITTDDKANYHPLNFAAAIAVGAERSFNGFTLRIFPRFAYSLTSYYNKDKTAMKIYPYSAGLGIGIYKVF